MAEYDRSGSVLYNYYKRDDIILQQLVNWLEENKVLANDGGFIKVYEVCPPELYINGLHVTKCSRDEDMMMDHDWMLSIVCPEHISNCYTDCYLAIDGQYIDFNVIIPK